MERRILGARLIRLLQQAAGPETDSNSYFIPILRILIVAAGLLASLVLYKSFFLPSEWGSGNYILAMEVSPDGRQIMMIKIDTVDDNKVSTVLLSKDQGHSWEEITTLPHIKNFSVDWTTGNGIVIQGPEKLYHHFPDINFPSLSDSMSIYGISNYGQSGRLIKKIPLISYLPDIMVDWKTGKGLIAASYPYYTTDSGRTWNNIVTNQKVSYGSYSNFFIPVVTSVNSNAYIFTPFLLSMIYSNDFKSWHIQSTGMGYNGYSQKIRYNDSTSTFVAIEHEMDFFNLKIFRENNSITNSPYTNQSYSNDTSMERGTSKPAYTFSIDSSYTITTPENRSADVFFFNTFSNSNRIIAVTRDVNKITNRVKFILFISDGINKNWEKHVIAPPAPPWIIISSYVLSVSCLILLAYLAFILYSIRKESKTKPSNISHIHPDTPTATDRLNFSRTSLAVANLLRSDKTKLPLTIALSGSWGKGKSSFMKQIRKELENDGRFVSLWFNVWHYQSEQHMLSAFFNHIFTSLGNKNNISNLTQFKNSYNFQLRLLKIQFRELSFLDKTRVYFGVLLMLPVVLFLLALLTRDFALGSVFEFVYNGVFEMGDFILNTRALGTVTDSTYMDRTETYYKNFIASKTSGFYSVSFQLIIGLIGVFLVNKDWLPFGLGKIVDLFPKDKFKVMMNQTDTTIRDVFKKEMGYMIEIASKSNKKIVVFLDDFDRIPGDKVREMLETINFVTDSASQAIPENISPCIVFIMAMSVDETLSQLGKALNGDIQNPADNRKKAALYIEKLVDLVVPVPDTNDENIRKYIESLLNENL